MSDDIFGYRCPICKTINPEKVKYCVHCGHWLLDTTFSAQPLNKEEYLKEFKSRPVTLLNTLKIILVVSAAIFFLIFLIGLLVSSNKTSQVLAPILGLSSLIGLAVAVIMLFTRALFHKGLKYKNITILAVASFITLCIAATHTPDKTATPTPSLEEIRTSAIDIPYDDLARNAKQLTGQKVHYTGNVIQVIESPPILRIDVAKPKPGEFVQSNKIIYITRKDNAGRILEYDTVEIWGTVKGLKTYTPWTGAPITIPEITSYYLVITKKAGDK